jgi:hypothetical protein
MNSEHPTFARFCAEVVAEAAALALFVVAIIALAHIGGA